MAYIRYSIKYGGTLRYSNSQDTSITIQYPTGTTRQTITSKTSKTMSCSGKMMTGNVKIGAKELSCKDKVMTGDLTVDTQVVSGSNYDVISSGGSWTVPPGVTSLTIFCVGGGGAGGLSGGYRTSSGNDQMSYGQGGGGGGGYTKQATVSVTPGETLTCAIGAGGSAGSFTNGQSWDSYNEQYRYYGNVNSGGRGGTTSVKRGNTVLCSADGGYAGGTNNITRVVAGGGSNGGSGGSGGGAGANSGTYESSYTGASGGSNGNNGGASPVSGGTAGSGQGTSTAFNGVTYAGGGGAGTSAFYMNSSTSYGRTNAGSGGTGGGAAGGNNAGSNGYGGGGGGYSRYPDENVAYYPSNKGGTGVIVFKW